MIIVLVRYTCKDGCREKFYEAIKKNGIDTASKEEEGNVMYEYSYGIKENELILTEVWKDDEATQIHMNSDHFKRLGELKAEYVENTAFLRYKGEQTNK